MVWVELIVTKMGGAHCGKNGWNWCYRHRDKNGWSSLLQKWLELTLAKKGETGVIDTVTKMDGDHCGKNWMELVL